MNKQKDDIVKIAHHLLDDINGINKSFKKLEVITLPDEEDSDAWAIASISDCIIADGKFNLNLQINVEIDGFYLSIYDMNHTFDENFANILKEMIPNLYKQYDFANRNGESEYKFKKKYKLNQYNEFIDIIIELIKNVDNFMEKKY